MNLSFYPLLPPWLLLLAFLLSVGAAFYAYRHRNPAVEPWQHRTFLALRLVALACVFFMLLCPGHITEDRNLEKSHLVFLLDRSASMSARDQRDGQTRLAQAVAFLQNTPLKRLADYPKDYFAFNGQAQRQSDARALAALAPEGGTDLKQAVDRVDKDIGLNRAAALVLVSDGIDTSGFKGGDIAVPVLSVQVGTDLVQSKDLSIEPFDCPDRVSEGEELTLSIPLLLQGYPRDQEVAFAVSLDGAPLRSETLTLSSSRTRTETVKATLAEAGVHVLRIDCGRLPDEVTFLNNRRELIVEAVKAKDAVAVYFPVLNTSFRPLAREFLKDADTPFTACYRVAGTTFRVLGNKPNPAFADGLPKNAEALRDVTCLILGAHNGALLSPAESLVLEQYVTRGGTLVCLAGTDAFGKIPPDSPLVRLLPVVTLDDSFRTGAYRVVPDPVGDAALAEQVAQIIADNKNAPELALNAINQVKDLKASAKVVLWAEGEARLPLLVWHPYGCGKVVALLSNAFGQWGAPDRRDENFGRFWRQLVAFAKNQDEDADLLKIALSKTEVAADEPVTVTAIARHPAGTNRTVEVKADLFLAASDTPLRSFALDKKTDCFVSEIPGLKPGRYVLRVSSQDGQDVLRTRYKLLLVGDALGENARLRSDRDVFRAFSSDKHIFGPDDAARLEDALREAVRRNVIQRENFLIFENPVFLILAVAFLFAEWFLRRRFNLF